MMLEVLPKDVDLQTVREAFSHDRYAVGLTGCFVEEAAYGHAVCSLELADKHFNMHDRVMGGAIFTLADFTLAIACNIGEQPTVAVSNTIDYLNSSKGQRLVATADVVKSGRYIGFYSIEVRDDLGVHVASMSAKCFRRPAE